MKQQLNKVSILGVDWWYSDNLDSFHFYVNFLKTPETVLYIRNLRTTYGGFDTNFKLTLELDILLRCFILNFKSLTKEEQQIKKDLIQKELISFFTTLIKN